MFLNDITSMAGETESWLGKEWTQRIIQISAYGAILFFVLSSYDLIGIVDKQLNSILGMKIGKEGTRALHAATFGIFMYIGIRFILDPLVKRLVNGQVVEGAGEEEGSEDEEDDEEGYAVEDDTVEGLEDDTVEGLEDDTVEGYDEEEDDVEGLVGGGDAYGTVGDEVGSPY